MNKSDVIRLTVTEEDIFEAIREAKERYFIDNLRNRNPIVSFDSKVRGKLGEIAIINWFRKHGITQLHTNIMDAHSCDIDLEIRSGEKTFSCEIKTSNIPDFTEGSVQRVIDNCDIKIIKRHHGQEIIIDRDIYIQIYYPFLTKEHDDRLISICEKSGVSPEADERVIYDTYGYGEYIKNVYLFAWDDKENITRRLQSMNPEYATYTISKRIFYTCKLKDSKAPALLPDFIKNA